MQRGRQPHLLQQRPCLDVGTLRVGGDSGLAHGGQAHAEVVCVEEFQDVAQRREGVLGELCRVAQQHVEDGEEGNVAVVGRFRRERRREVGEELLASESSCLLRAPAWCRGGRRAGDSARRGAGRRGRCAGGVRAASPAPTSPSRGRRARVGSSHTARRRAWRRWPFPRREACGRARMGAGARTHGEVRRTIEESESEGGHGLLEELGEVREAPEDEAFLPTRLLRDHETVEVALGETPQLLQLRLAVGLLTQEEAGEAGLQTQQRGQREIRVLLRERRPTRPPPSACARSRRRRRRWRRGVAAPPCRRSAAPPRPRCA